MRRSLLSLVVANGMSLLNNCKLTYFDIAGRGEALRLALTLGGVAFVDHRVQFGDWKTLKPETPWGSLPILTLTTGVEIAQQRAILRMIGKETGLYPTDLVQAALVDSLMDAVEDAGPLVNKQGQGLPQEEKEAARAASVAPGGAVYQVLQRIETFIGKHGSNGFAVGDKMTIADIFVFASMAALVSGLYDGVPLDAIDNDDFTNIMGVRKSVRAVEAIEKYYSDSPKKVAASYGPF